METIKKFEGKKYDPYPHQIKIASILDEMDSEGNFSTIITVPTGGGKTRIATDFCLKVLENKNNKVLWLCDSVDLLGQAIKSFEENNVLRELNYRLICGTAVSRDTVGNFGRSVKGSISEPINKIDGSEDIVFASVETLVQTQKDKKDNEDANYKHFSNWLEKVQGTGKIYCIYDEVHHIGAEQTEKFFSKLFGVAGGKAVLEKFALIGLTATVYRHDSPIASFNRWFKNGYIDGKYYKEESIYGVGADTYTNNRIEVTSIQELTDAKLLMKPKIIRVDDFKAGIPETSLEAMSYLAEKIIRNYEEKKWNKTIVFVDGVTNAKTLKKKLGEKVPSFVYTSETLDDINDELSAFKKTDGTECSLMIAVDMVSEGFDVKDIETIYLFSRVGSQILIRQRVGRVLRTFKSKDGKRKKEKATVYWQNYFDYDKPKTIKEYKGLFDNDIEEDDADIQRDIALWKKGYQLPAGMYLEELPRDMENESSFYKRYEYLHALELFGLDAVLRGIGYYELGDFHLIVGTKEKRGYEQFYRVIVSDYYSLLMLKDNYSTFKDYAKALGVSEQELLDDIKLTCFYMSNSSERDTKGNILKKKFHVSDEEIKTFYKWVISNDLSMPAYKEIDTNVNKSNDKTEDENENENEQTDDTCEVAGFKEYLNDNDLSPKDNMLDGIMLYQKYVNHREYIKNKKPKLYSDILIYGKRRNILYYEMKSAQAIMSAGAIAGKREQGTLNNVTGSLALIAKNEDGSYEEVKVLKRTTKDIEDDDLLLAQALVTVPNRISINKDDVKKYQKAIKDVLEAKGNIDIDLDKAAQEFLMALGYSKNDGIIRMQVELFGETLPRILQYVIYCKAYEKLADIVDYFDDEIPLPVAKNINEMNNVYQAVLSDYGVKQLDEDLKPVADVLTDFRPYIKIVKYYQGIKPEFLCRMLNEMLRLGKKEGCIFNDGFGGSGTISLNIDSNLNMKKEYNDLGILNEALFKSLQNCKGQELKERASSFIDLILNHTGDEKAARDFLSPYASVIARLNEKNYDFASDTLATIENEYQQSFNESVDIHNSGTETKWLSLDERLLVNEELFSAVFKVCYKEVDTKELRAIEEYLHALMLILDRLYLELNTDEKPDYVELSDTDLAFLFFIYYFMSSRHFYNDATINKFAGFVGVYEQYIENSAAVVADMKIYCEDANKLINDLKEDADRIWYCDIPYSETDVANYSSDWFDEAKFVNALDASKGDYIVASRYNICDGRKGGLDSISSSEEEVKLSNKQKNIIKFFLRFLPKKFVSQYYDEIKRLSMEEENEKDGYDGDNANPWSYISEDRAAKYIVFAFTNTEQTISEKGGTGYVKNRYTVTKDSVRRMLKNTQISNVEVEIMLTSVC